jgi:hypothetical protein
MSLHRLLLACVSFAFWRETVVNSLCDVGMKRSVGMQKIEPETNKQCIGSWKGMD